MPTSFNAGVPALAQLQPLQFQQIAVPAITPTIEPIKNTLAETISAGLSEVGKGITAAYKSKQEREDKIAERAEKQQAEKEKFGQQLALKQSDRDFQVRQAARKFEYDKVLAGMRGANAQDLAELKEGLKNRGADSWSKDTSLESKDQAVDSTPSEGKPFDRGLLNENLYKDTGPLQQTEPIEIVPDNKEGVGSADVQNYFDSLKDIFSPSNIRYVTASTTGVSGGLDQADVPSAVQQTPSAPDIQQSRKFTLPTAQDLALAMINKPYQEKTSLPTPRFGFDTEDEMRAYVKAYKDKAGEEPEYTAESFNFDPKTQKFIVKWKGRDEEAFRLRKETAKTKTDIQKQNVMNREASQFNAHPYIKAFTAVNGMQQTLPRFVRDYEAIAKNPEAAGISDVGLLDMFARAEGGGRVTEGQARLVLSSNSLLEKARTLGLKLAVGGDQLDQSQRDQMLRVIHEDYVAQARIANQAVEMARKKLKKQGITDEDELPQPFIIPKTKWEAEDEIKQMSLKASNLHQQKKKAQAEGNAEKVKELDAQLEEIGDEAIKTKQKIKASKGMIINLDEVETTPQGWTGGANTAILQQN